MLILKFAAKHPHAGFLCTEVCEGSSALCRLQTRKLRQGLLLHRATHTNVLSIKQTAPDPQQQAASLTTGPDDVMTNCEPKREPGCPRGRRMGGYGPGRGRLYRAAADSRTPGGRGGRGGRPEGLPHPPGLPLRPPGPALSFFPFLSSDNREGQMDSALGPTRSRSQVSQVNERMNG